MKTKLLLLAVAILGLFPSNAKAQLAPYSQAPNFTITDLQGVDHTLYDYLDQGYTVYLDLYAVWCGPCWNYHQTHQLENLWTQAGPGGTDKVIVMGVEADASTAVGGITTPGVDGSLGDWTQGISYIMANDDNIASLYNLAYYPTIYMISPNRLVYEVGQQPTQDLLDASNESWVLGPITQADDAAALIYEGDDLSLCGDLNTEVMIQNHGTNALTSATIEVMNGGSSVSTYNWTGNLASYATAVVDLGTAPISSNAGTIEITTSDDDMTNNDVDYEVTLVASKAAPEMVDMEIADAAGVPEGLYDYGVNSTFQINKGSFQTPPADELGGYGNSVNSLFFYFYNAGAGTVSELVTKKLDFSTVSNAKMTFDVAYAQYGGTENDMLTIYYSIDCGANWVSAYSKSGSDLATTDPIQGLFVAAADDWRTETIDLSAVDGQSEVLIKITGTSDYGNNIYFDNLNTGEITSVEEVSVIEEVSLYPNPAQNVATINVNVKDNAGATVKVMDIAGRTLEVVNTNMVSGMNAINLNTEAYNNGVYFVEVTVNGTVSTSQLVIQK